MYKCKEEENYIVIYNERRKFRVLKFKKPNQINIVDVTYGNKTTGGYWANINDYCDEFISKVIFFKHLELNKMANKQNK